MTDKTSPNLQKIKTAKLIALVGFFGIFLLVPVWHLWLAPPMEGMSKAFVMAIWFTPLLFPLKGLVQGKPYTYAWSNFVCMFYFLHSLTLIYASEHERVLASIEFIFSPIPLQAFKFTTILCGSYSTCNTNSRRITH